MAPAQSAAGQISVMLAARPPSTSVERFTSSPHITSVVNSEEPPAEKNAAAPARPDRIVVGGLVRPPAPVFAPQPVYPRIAVQTRIFGVVRLEAVIGTDGTVRHLRLVQGHPILATAAIEAVRQWRYTPTLLNGDPVEVIMQVDVHFSLRQ